MIQYRLVDSQARKDVNLLEYEDTIISIVHNICPYAKVKVKKDAYYLSDNVPRGCKIRIGRSLAKSEVLGCYYVNRPVLFKGKSMEKKSKKKRS